MEANAAAVSNLSDPVMRGSGGVVLRDIVNVGEQPLHGCQHISSRIMADRRAVARPGKTAETFGKGRCWQFECSQILAQTVCYIIAVLWLQLVKICEKQPFASSFKLIKHGSISSNTAVFVHLED